MITLHKTEEGIHIADLYENESDQSSQAIYWYPRKKKDLRLGLEDVEPYLESEEFRNYYRLHPSVAKIIAKALLKGRPLEEKVTKSVQRKYWDVKKDLENKIIFRDGFTWIGSIYKVGFPSEEEGLEWITHNNWF